MKIASQALEFSSQYQLVSQHSLKESARVWVGAQRPDFEGQAMGVQPQSLPRRADSHVSLSAAARVANRASVAAANAQAVFPGRDKTVFSPAVASSTATHADSEADSDPKLRMIRQMVKLLTGKDIKVFNLPQENTSEKAARDLPSVTSNTAANSGMAGYGVEYDRHEVWLEMEATSFQAQGVVHTEDGRALGFQLNLEMQRRHVEETQLSVRLGDAVRKDPLVINFAGQAAELQSQRFSFDLDADGQGENIALLAGHSGYLALDRNINGRVDDGSELFGALTGNGFLELTQFDDDANGWIDENDAVFDSLRVWTPAADGPGHLATLRERQVGALYLGQQITPFELRDASNQFLGAVRATGVWLAESGQAGTLQQIDLTV